MVRIGPYKKITKQAKKIAKDQKERERGSKLQLPSNIDKSQHDRDHQNYNREKNHRIGGRGGILQQRDLIRDYPANRSALTSRHEADSNEIPHDQSDDKNGTNHDAGFGERDNNIGEGLEA